MKRRRPSILIIFSTCLLVAAACMWIRSLFWQDQIGIMIADLRFWLGSSSQRLWLKGSASFSDSPGIETNIGQDRADPTRLEQLLPAYKKGIWTRSIAIPYWFIVLPASILPLRSLMRTRQPRRHRT